MSFLSGNMFWHLLWIIPLILAAAVAGGARRKDLLRKIFGSCERAAHFTDTSRGKRVFRTLLLVSAVLLLLAAAARPSWGKQDMLDGLPEETRGLAASDGHDLLVLFDVSKSMYSEDVRPTRMDHAKWLVRKIAESAPGNRFGLIPFAGEAFLVCPLTIDNANLFRILDDLDPGVIPVGGTNIQFALEEAVKAFQDSPGKHKAVILVTDGDELTGQSADVVDELKKAQIPVFAVGVGDPANPAAIRTPDKNGNLQFLRYRDDPVKSPLNETQLKDLASKTGGFYIRSTTAHDGVDEIVRQIENLDMKESEEPASAFRPLEHPAYPLAAALILLAVFFCISETRPRPVQTVFLLAALILFSIPADARAQSAPAAEKDVKRQAEAPSAGETPEEKVTAGPEERTPSELYNAGLEFQQEKHDYENARILYERAISASEKEPDIRASAYQNLGVISHLEARSSLKEAEEELQAQDYKAAEKTLLDAEQKLRRTEELYRESMRSGTNTAPAVRNQQMLLAELKQADRMNARIEEWKKKQEELKKLAEQAAKQTQQAHDRQQQENRRQEQRKQQEEETGKLMEQAQEKTREARDIQQQENRRQEQQDRNAEDIEQAMEQAREKIREARDIQQQENRRQEQQSGQDRQAGDESQQQDRQAAQESAREAEEAVSELEQSASEANQEAQEQAAKQALEEIQKAREEQRQGNGEKAEEHLTNALDELNRDREQSGQDRQAGDESQQQDRQAAQESAREAEEAVSELEQSASEANQEAQEQAAKQALEEIQKAREEQRQGNGEKAEEHLTNALDELQQAQKQAEQEEQDRRQQAQDEARQAEQSLSELEKMASEMNRQMQEQAAKQALEELRKALEEQEQGNGEKAEEHLKNAVETLKQELREQQEQEEQDRQDQAEQNEQDEQEGQEGQEEQNEQQSGEAETRNTDESFDMDKHQAEAILNRMLKEELKLRDVSPTRRSSRNRKVEKDW